MLEVTQELKQVGFVQSPLHITAAPLFLILIISQIVNLH